MDRCDTWNRLLNKQNTPAFTHAGKLLDVHFLLCNGTKTVFSQLLLIIKSPQYTGVILCFCTSSYAAAAAGRRLLFTR